MVILLPSKRLSSDTTGGSFASLKISCITGDDSEEVVQETFPKAFRHLEMRERAMEKFNPKSAAEREEEQQEEEFLNGKTPKEATYDH